MMHPAVWVARYGIGAWLVLATSCGHDRATPTPTSPPGTKLAVATVPTVAPAASTPPLATTPSSTPTAAQPAATSIASSPPPTGDAPDEPFGAGARSDIPCQTDDDCWVSGGSPERPIARPPQLRGKRFEPCMDGEGEPTCMDGRCGLIFYDC